MRANMMGYSAWCLRSHYLKNSKVNDFLLRSKSLVFRRRKEFDSESRSSEAGRLSAVLTMVYSGAAIETESVPEMRFNSLVWTIEKSLRPSYRTTYSVI